MSLYIVMGFLMLAVLWNIANVERLLVAAVVSSITLISYWVYYFGPAEYLIHHMGYWGYLSLAPIISIGVLYFIRNVTSTSLMLLFVVLIFTHLICYLVELFGVTIDEGYQYISWAFFAIEILILMSERVSHAVFNLCHRVYHSSHLDRNHPDYWPKNSIGTLK